MMSYENNPIGYLQEICQKQNMTFPEYKVVDSSGPDHCKKFTQQCTFQGFEALGHSAIKQQAKSEAARAMLVLLDENGYLEKLRDDLKKEVNNVALVDKNPISAIHEYCQKNGLPLPVFKDSSHLNNTFKCECILQDKKTCGFGISKKIAKTEAAKKMCLELNLNSCVDCLLEESEVDNVKSKAEHNIVGRNPISELQELIAKDSSFKYLEYTELRKISNLFVIRCTVDSISCDGKATTKKLAKTEAAKQVLEKLKLRDSADWEGPSNAVCSQVSSTVTRSRQEEDSLEDSRRKLRDFNLDTSDEEDVNLDKKEKEVNPDKEDKEVKKDKKEKEVNPDKEDKEVKSKDVEDSRCKLRDFNLDTSDEEDVSPNKEEEGVKSKDELRKESVIKRWHENLSNKVLEQESEIQLKNGFGRNSEESIQAPEVGCESSNLC